jgi:MYXO-CTERM domain-containing protein
MVDSGSSDATADAEGDAGAATPGQSNGCGCKAAGAEDATSPPVLVALAGLGLVVVRGRRSRRATASKASS